MSSKIQDSTEPIQIVGVSRFQFGQDQVGVCFVIALPLHHSLPEPIVQKSGQLVIDKDIKRRDIFSQNSALAIQDLPSQSRQRLGF